MKRYLRSEKLPPRLLWDNMCEQLVLLWWAHALSTQTGLLDDYLIEQLKNPTLKMLLT
jgi:hypothetical protein